MASFYFSEKDIEQIIELLTARVDSLSEYVLHIKEIVAKLKPAETRQVEEVSSVFQNIKEKPLKKKRGRKPKIVVEIIRKPDQTEQKTVGYTRMEDEFLAIKSKQVSADNEKEQQFPKKKKRRSYRNYRRKGVFLTNLSKPRKI
ncbi:MAG: hypothetical protein Q8867_08705 [Bacteroidota bacterium]|nr:hypothetical protein [Bacteroidota bacterium]